MIRKPTHAEAMYLDADGFFASCEQFMHPHLRSLPVGIVPMISGSSCVIAVSREAKAMGVSNVMPLQEARAVCPDLVLWPQNPDLYRRAHGEMCSIVRLSALIEMVMSIDEMCCILGNDQLEDPQAVGLAIKADIAEVFGESLNLSMGYGANPLLAKMACKAGKPAGNMVWHPRNIYQHLMSHELSDIPGIGPGTEARLHKAGITTVERLLDLSPSHMAAIWGSIQGRRMHYALHGYDVTVSPTQRRMFGHSRMLPPSSRSLPTCRPVARLLLTKATRRMRREQFRASRLTLGISVYARDGNRTWHKSRNLPEVADYNGILNAMGDLWQMAETDIGPRYTLQSAHVFLSELSDMSRRQLDMFTDDEAKRLREESLSDAIDKMNHRYCSTVLYHGIRDDVPADNIGMKIAYGRVPRAEDRY